MEKSDVCRQYFAYRSKQDTNRSLPEYLGGRPRLAEKLNTAAKHSLCGCVGSDWRNKPESVVRFFSFFQLKYADKMREIMKHKSIDKIRVTEICKAADIERPTFYYHFKDKLGDNILDTQLAYSILFYCMGSVGMTQEWVLNDNITSAETVVQMMFQSIPENMRTILF